jgi:GH15 family glucan-1,4-alpha-glucosidase
MRGTRFLFLFSAGLATCLPCAASHLVTGNGFGFAVVTPEKAVVTRFSPHPYSFVRPDLKAPLSEGAETANFIKQLTWSRGGEVASVEYENDSQVIHIHRADGDGFAYMPFGMERPTLVVSWEARGPKAAGGFEVEWNKPVLSQRLLKPDGSRVLRFEGIEESLLLIPLETNHAPAGDSILSGSRAWALIALEGTDDPRDAVRDFDAWRAGVGADALVKRELDEVEKWRVRPAVHFASEAERHLWRQSEVMLRIAQSREPNRAGRHGNGLIVASLPDGVWATPWVRDMAWATVALARMGHRAEARAALLAYFNAQPTGKMRAETAGADYQVSVVRYWGNGEEEPFFTMEGSTNIEFDDWGEALWALGEYLRTYDDDVLLRTATHRGSLYQSARDFVVKPLLANLEKFGNGTIVAADTSIWEERQKDKKHFAFSTAIAIVGLKEFAEVARRAGDEATAASVLRQAAALEEGFDAAFIRGGKLHGTLEEGVKNDIDGALMPILNFGVVTDPAVVRDAVERMELLRVASGGYRRVRSMYTDPAIFEYWYERQEFLFVDLSLAELERRLGRDAQAGAMLKRIVDKASADHNIIPEMYVAVPCALFPGKIGDPTGALPMVGYGAGAFVLHVLEREELRQK